MAAIGSIRKHSTLLVIIIGGALAAFIFGSLVNKRSRRDVNAGKVNGVEITIMEFNNMVDKNIESAKQRQRINSLSTDETFRIKEQTWEQMVRKIIMDKEDKELGIKVTTDEMFNLIQGKNPAPLIKKYFVNPNTGKFDRNRVIQFLQNYNQMPDRVKKQWIALEDYIRQDQLRSKFNALIANAYYVPKELARKYYNQQNIMANITYIAARYSDVPDSLVQVTNSNYQAYYDAHRSEFKQKESRSLEYVAFNVVPSKADVKKAKKDAEATWKYFVQTDRPEEFARGNTDKPYDTAWLKKSQLPPQLASLMFHSKVGTVSKPYFQNYSFIMARLLGSARRPDSMDASHILIAYKGALRANPIIDRTKAEAKQLADSLYKVLKRDPGKMKFLAKEYSDDPSVKRNQGNLGWFADGQMIGAFNEAVVHTPIGRVALVETPFGFHIIKVNGKKDYFQKVKVAIITQEVAASNNTYQNVFTKASKFATDAQSISKFEKVAQKDHYQLHVVPKILETTYIVPGLENPREIVKWAFKSGTAQGQISSVFDFEDQFVVAIITKEFRAGIPSLDQVKPLIQPFVVNEVKGKYLAEKMKAFHGNMGQLAKAMHLSQQKVSNLTFDTRNLLGFGMENKVIGTVFGMKTAQVSQPIVGNAATFVVRLDKLMPAEKLPNYNQFLSSLNFAFVQRVEQGFPYVAIKKTSIIEDHRIDFY